MGNEESKLKKEDKAVQCDILSPHGPKLELVPYVTPDKRMMSLCQRNPKEFAAASVDKLLEELKETDVNNEEFRRAMEYSEEDKPYRDHLKALVEQLNPTSLKYVKKRGVAESVKFLMKFVFDKCMNFYDKFKVWIWAGVGLGLTVAIFGIAGIFFAPLRSCLVFIFQRLAAFGWLNIFSTLSTIVNVGAICKEVFEAVTCKDDTKKSQ